MAAEGTAQKSETKRTVISNRKARYEYEILETIEAGIALLGTEVKSVRAGHVSLQESFAHATNGELWLEGCSILPYELGTHTNHEPTRPRKLLLHRRELEKLTRRAAERGLTIIPLALYFKGARLKVELGLARGKKMYDKRDSIKQRDVDRARRRGEE